MRFIGTSTITSAPGIQVDVIEWRPVVGYEGFYEVSSDGRVRSLDRVIIDALGRTRRLKGQLLTPVPNQKRGGYYYVSIGPVSRRVNVLVLEAFRGPRPEGTVGCHNDGYETNNVTFNLRWDSHSANQYDIVRHGRHRNANKLTCGYGHRLVAPNLRPAVIEKQNGGRGCLACSRAHAVMQKARLSGTDHLLDFQAVADQKYRALGFKVRTELPPADLDEVRAQAADTEAESWAEFARSMDADLAHAV
jgi:hypothetical protein